MPGRRPEHQAHHRHETREIGEGLQVVGPTPRRGTDDAMPGTLEHEDERDPLLGGKLHEAIALVRRARPDGAAQHREVLCGSDGGTTVDRSEPTDEGVGRGVRRPWFRLVPDQGTELDERPGVEESRHARPCVQLAGGTMPGHPFLAAHGGGLGTLRGQLVQERGPCIPSGRGFHRRAQRSVAGGRGPRLLK